MACGSKPERCNTWMPMRSASCSFWVGALGSILLAMASPQAGMAALTGTLAGTRQGMISFTQQNEQEADRIGIQVLQRSGFDPQARRY